MTETVEDNSTIESLIRKAKKVGFETVPESTSELELKLVELMKQSGKIHTAKQMYEIFQEKNSKWFSDKMWNLAKKKVLVHLDKRGFYQYNKDNTS